MLGGHKDAIGCHPNMLGHQRDGIGGHANWVECHRNMLGGGLGLGASLHYIWSHVWARRSWLHVGSYA